MNTINQIILTALNYEFLVTDAYAYFVLTIGIMVMTVNLLRK